MARPNPPILRHAQPPILRQLAVAIGFCLFLPLKSLKKYSPKPGPMARPNPPILWHTQPPQSYGTPNPPQSYGAPRRQNPTATGSCHRILPFSAFKIIKKNTAQNPVLWHAQTPQSYGTPNPPNPTACPNPPPHFYGTPNPPNPMARPTPQSYGARETQSHKAVRQPVPAQQSSVRACLNLHQPTLTQ